MADQEHSNLPTPEQVITALDRTGFILEHRVYQTMRSLGFDSFLNDPFEDSETGKTREIDVVAIRSAAIRRKSKTRVMTAISLMIECKNYSDPLAIIGHDLGYSTQHAHPVITHDPLIYEFSKHDPEKNGGLDRQLELWKREPHRTKGFVGNQLVRMNRQSGKWQATNDGVYDSIILPLAKATKAEKAELMKDREDPWILPSINYCLPVLVTSGRIFAIDLTETSTPQVSLVPWAPVARTFSDGQFIIDVVTCDELTNYIKSRIFPLQNDAIKVIKSKLRFFDPVWLNRTFGDSEDQDFHSWLEYFLSKVQS